MQIWGTGAFDNDPATAWVRKFDRAAPAARPIVTRAALSAVFDRNDEVAGFTALAAATTVAAAFPGRPLLASGFGPKTLADSAFTPTSDLADLALAALERVASPTSEWSVALTRHGRIDDALAVLDAVTDELRERSERSVRVRAAS